jgi:hypothetical protein
MSSRGHDNIISYRLLLRVLLQGQELRQGVGPPCLPSAREAAQL